MQFHEYVTFRTQMIQSGNERQQGFARKKNSHELREAVLEWFGTEANSNNADDFNMCSIALAESVWTGLDRPYYNVWPIIMPLAASVKLSLLFSQVTIPFHGILLRFAKGHEPHHLRTALLFWPKGLKTIQVFCHFADEANNLLTVQHAFEPHDTVEEWIANLEQRGSQLPDYQHSAGLLMVRLVVLIGLLSRNEDIITPIVLAKDRAKYEATDDNSVKHWLEERAARRAGRGFNIGMGLQHAKDKSPHWRNPHLCLFWTGEGRTIPVIQLRSGAIVQSASMATVPTGYLGPENDKDDEISPEKTLRESISARRRFDIMKRDGFRCQLCGASSTDGVQLHIDHRVPLAKGGSNEDDNLWTLCGHCNLGKSDKSLGF